MACQPTQSRVSSSGSRDLAMMVGDFVDAETLGAGRRWLAGWCVRAILAFPVHAGKLRSEFRLLGEEFGIPWRGRRCDLKKHDLAAKVGRELHMIEAMALGG